MPSPPYHLVNNGSYYRDETTAIIDAIRSNGRNVREVDAIRVNSIFG